MSLMNAFIEYHIVDITFVNTILSSKLSATPLEAFKGGYYFYGDFSLGGVDYLPLFWIYKNLHCKREPFGSAVSKIFWYR